MSNLRTTIDNFLKSETNICSDYGKTQIFNLFLFFVHIALASTSYFYEFKNKNGKVIKDVTKCLPQNRIYEYKILDFLNCDDELADEYSCLKGYTGSNFEGTCDDIIGATGMTGMTGATGMTGMTGMTGSNENNCSIPRNPPKNCSVKNDINMNWSNFPYLPYWKITDLLTLFFSITAIAHFTYGTNGFATKAYDNAIKNTNNWMRWIEYAITATIMILVISRSSGVSEKESLKLITVMMVVVMLQGQITEMCINMYYKTNDEDIRKN